MVQLRADRRVSRIDSALKPIGDMAQATTLLDASDKPAFTIFKEQRLEVPLERMSRRTLIKAVVAVEDQRFYEHSGVDVHPHCRRGAEEPRARAARAKGGSTITQQLARQSFLTRDKTYRRKLQEVILAAYIEKMYGKDEILELYLNKVYFGGGLYGVEAASRGYFGKPAQRPRRRRGRAARRPDPVAIELRSDRQSRSRGRAAQRRAAVDGRAGAIDQAPPIARADAR